MEKTLWAAILSDLKLELSPAAFKTWFSNCRLGEVEEVNKGTDKIEIICNSNFSREQLEKRYQDILTQMINQKTGKRNKLVFQVGQVPGKKQIENELAFFQAPAQIIDNPRKSPFFKNFTFENLIIGRSNKLAVSAAEAVIESLGNAYNPLFFFGSSGVGKTHLLHAVANHFASVSPNLKVVYLTGEHFTNNYIDALISKQIKKFREDLRSVDVFLVDDIQFLASKENTQEEFFHTFNELYLSSKQIILTSDKHPSKIGGLEERLISRFLGGLTVEIRPPDYEMKIKLIQKKSQKIGFSIPQGAASLLAQKTNGSVRDLEGAIFKVFSSSKLANQAPSVKMIKDLFSQEESKTKISPKDILSAVQNHFKLKGPELTSISRKKEVLLPRQLAMFFLREYAGLSLDAIGKIFGNRDHSTVMHAIAKIKNLNEKDLETEKIIGHLKTKILS